MAFLKRRDSTTLAAVLSISAAFLAGCASPQPKASLGKSRSKEYFAESEYGVKASPRVTTKRTRLPRGGGRDQVGKPYQVKGKWYYPKEMSSYSKAGKASWYGDAFHGRLTANGEIYDMTHLTAAHPTMPLPSYAKVTNVANGSSIVVRVNDRGPYAHGRIIDLSRRAAEMLDYTRTGVAEVKVEYMGRAPLHGQDDAFLLASYRPGGRAPDPSDGLPAGVMVAMAGLTPTADAATSAPTVAASFPGVMTASAATVNSFGAAVLSIPDFGPVISERPVARLGDRLRPASQVLSYADDRVSRAAGAFSAFASYETEDAGAFWKQQAAQADFIAFGSFASMRQAVSASQELRSQGRVEIERALLDGVEWHSVRLYSVGRASLDDLLRQSWNAGASDAFVVRN
jgi:rare lipoprotein A